MERIITKFRFTDGEYVGEIEATHIPLSALRRIINPPSDDLLMEFCYELGADQVADLQAFVEERFDTRQYRYYLEAVQDAAKSGQAEITNKAEVI